MPRALPEQLREVMSAHSGDCGELRQRNIGSEVRVDVIENPLQKVSRQTASVTLWGVVLRGVAGQKIYGQGIPVKPPSGGAFIKVGRHREKDGHDVPVRQIPVLGELDVRASNGFIQSAGEQAGMDCYGNALSGTAPSELVDCAARKYESGSRP